MKKLFKTIHWYLLAALLLLAVNPVSSFGEAKYYGYFMIDDLPEYQDNITTVKDFTNLNHMGLDTVLLQRCRDTGTKALLDLRWQFFPAGTTLRSDYVAHWNTLSAQIAPYIAEVGAFYICDEPYWNGFSKADIETVSALLKTTFPTTPTMIIEAYPEITVSYNPPTNVDWIGFDWYGSYSPEIPNYLAILKTRISATQRIFLVPQGFIKGSETDAQVAAWNQSYYDLAVAEPKVIGLLVFRYGTSKVMPLTYAKQQQIGALVGDWTPNPWPLPWCGDALHPTISEDINGDCYVDLDDLAILCEHWGDSTVPGTDWMSVINGSFESPVGTGGAPTSWIADGGVYTITINAQGTYTPYGNQWLCLDTPAWNIPTAGAAVYQLIGTLSNNTNYKVSFLGGSAMWNIAPEVKVWIAAKTTGDWWTWPVLGEQTFTLPIGGTGTGYSQEYTATFNSGSSYDGSDMYIVIKASTLTGATVERALIDNIKVKILY